MTLTSKIMITLACSALTVGAYAYDDPQTDYDSLHSTKSDTEQENRAEVDLSVLETVERRDNIVQRVDPQTDYDSVYMTDYLESLER